MLPAFGTETAHGAMSVANSMRVWSSPSVASQGRRPAISRALVVPFQRASASTLWLMAHLVLVVEDLFLVPALGGLVFAPDVAEDIEPGGYDAELVLTDGSRRRAAVRIDWVSFNPTGFRLVCCAPELTKSEVLIGTEIWIDESRPIQANEQS